MQNNTAKVIKGPPLKWPMCNTKTVPPQGVHKIVSCYVKLAWH